MPGPDRSRNFAIVDSGESGARSWMHEAVPTGSPPTDIIASRTPCSSLVSSWATRIPKVSR